VAAGDLCPTTQARTAPALAPAKVAAPAPVA
jgi:hypothetical protein